MFVKLKAGITILCKVEVLQLLPKYLLLWTQWFTSTNILVDQNKINVMVLYRKYLKNFKKEDYILEFLNCNLESGIQEMSKKLHENTKKYKDITLLS